MKSKKGPSRKTEDSSNINVPPPPPQQQSNVGNSLFTNVQQQQTSNNLPPTFQMNDMPPQVFQLPQQINDWSLPQVSNANFAQQQNSIFSQPQVSNAKFAQQQNSLFSQQQMPVMQQQMPMMQQQMPMMQQQVRQSLQSNAALESRLRDHARQRSRLGLGVRVAERALPLTAAEVQAIVAESWELHHPAAEPVDTAGAHLFVQLLELTGDDLQRRLHQLGVLRVPDAGGVDFERFDQIMKYEVA